MTKKFSKYFSSWVWISVSRLCEGCHLVECLQCQNSNFIVGKRESGHNSLRQDLMRFRFHSRGNWLDWACWTNQPSPVSYSSTLSYQNTLGISWHRVILWNALSQQCWYQTFVIQFPSWYDNNYQSKFQGFTRCPCTNWPAEIDNHKLETAISDIRIWWLVLYYDAICTVCQQRSEQEAVKQFDELIPRRY